MISLDAEPAFHEDGRDDALFADGSSGLDDPAVQTELRAVLSSTISELPPQYRAAIVLHDVEGLSMAEVSDALGITVGTAKSRAHRGRLLLRKRLSMFMASADPCAELSLESFEALILGSGHGGKLISSAVTREPWCEQQHAGEP